MRLVKMGLAGAALLTVASTMVLRAAQPRAAAREVLLDGLAASRFVVYVAPGPSPLAALGDGSPARPFASIARALRSAPAGAEIRIAEGTYHERLAITRPVTLVGAGALRTHIVAPEGEGTILVILGSDRVSVRGLSLEGGATGIEIDGGAGHRFEDVALRGASRTGLLAHGAELTFLGGEVIDVAYAQGGFGLLLEGGSLELRDSVLRRAGRRALALRHARGRVVDADIEGSGLSALQATGDADVEVVRGRFAHQGGAALFASASRLRVEGTRIEGNELGVVAFRGARVDVDGAQIFDHRVAGVALTSATGAVRRSVLVRGGSDAAIAISNSQAVVLEDNHVLDPGPLGIHVTRSDVTLRGNEVRGARLDRYRDFGDGIFAVDADLVMRGNVLRSNAGHGASFSQSRVDLASNDLLGNGRGGMLLFHRSRATLAENLFADNAGAGLEVIERSRALLRRNRFGQGRGPAIDGSCGEAGHRGIAELEEGNTFAPGAGGVKMCP